MYIVGPLVSRDFGYFVSICYGHSLFGFTSGRIVRIGVFSLTINKLKGTSTKSDMHVFFTSFSFFEIGWFFSLCNSASRFISKLLITEQAKSFDKLSINLMF